MYTFNNIIILCHNISYIYIYIYNTYINYHFCFTGQTVKTRKPDTLNSLVRQGSGASGTSSAAAASSAPARADSEEDPDDPPLGEDPDHVLSEYEAHLEDVNRQRRPASKRGSKKADPEWSRMLMTHLQHNTEVMSKMAEKPKVPSYRESFMGYVTNVLAGVSDDQWLSVQRRVMEALEPVSPPPPEQQIQNIIPQASTSTSVSASMPSSASLPLQQLPIITTSPFPNYHLMQPMQPIQPIQPMMTVVETPQLDTGTQQRDSLESVQTEVLTEFLRNDAPNS